MADDPADESLPVEIPPFQLEGFEDVVAAPEAPAQEALAQHTPPQELPIPDAPNAPDVPNAPDAIDQLKQFSEQVAMEKVQVPASFPFSLLIDGELSVDEKEKLLGLLARENIGIREVDLELQLEGGRVLIPRISEYAGVLLVQALRGTRARMRLGPSDELDTDPVLRSGSRNPPELSHPAEGIAITSDDRLPQLPRFSVIDLVTASATLASRAVETESSAEYQEILDNLQRELRYKAYRKGGVAITLFKIQLQPLTLPAQYRLTVSGTAIKPDLPETPAEQPAQPDPGYLPPNP